MAIACGTTFDLIELLDYSIIYHDTKKTEIFERENYLIMHAYNLKFSKSYIHAVHEFVMTKFDFEL